jgi:predicted kinase
MAEKILYLIRGLPGSGKSTMAKKIMRTSPTADHWEADQYFENANGEYRFDVTRLHSAHNWCQNQTYRSMKVGRTVIVSNTFTTQSEMKPYFEMAAAFGYKVVVLTCKSQFKNVHDVPQEAMARMRNRFDYTAEDKLYEIYFPES